MIKLNDGRDELFQWDSGRTATVAIDCDTVHFSNIKYGDALVVAVHNGTVDIPNQLLINPAPIYCWAFTEDADGAYTIAEQELAVIKRAKPSDYVYTETEVLNVNKAVENAVKKAVESGAFDGTTFYPNVSASGVISWTNDRGYKNPAPVNIKGKDGKDGYTPIKGVDYFDGKDGANGLNGKDGADGLNGKDGKDGISATHNWNGTILTISSASGTSSADLKGEQGLQGIQGPAGPQGEKGERGEPGAPGVSDLSGDGVSGILPVDKGGTGASSPYQAARRLGRTTAICNDSADTALIQIYENKINNFSATYGCILAVFFKNGNTAPGLELATRRTESSSVYRSVVYNNETGNPLVGNEIQPNNVYLFSWTEKANGLPDRWVLLNPSSKSIRDALPTNSAPLPISKGGTGGISAFQASRRLGRTYYNCNAAADATDITVNINTFGVGDGCLVFLRFTNGNTASQPKLTITNTADNKSTSAKIYNTYTNQPLTGTEIKANQVCALTYDSGNGRWILLNPYMESGSSGGGSGGSTKSTPNLTLSVNSLTMNMPALDEEAEIETSYIGNGILTATTTDPKIATASFYDDKIFINAHKKGSCSLIVNVSETNTFASQTLSIPVSVILPDEIFSNNTWAKIAEAVRKNRVPDSWKVGDSKLETMENIEDVGGGVADCSIVIIGKNHDVYADGSGVAPLTFQLKPSIGRYPMNTDGTANDWENSDMRNTYLPQFKAKMEEDIRENIRAVSKQTGNTAYSENETPGRHITVTEEEVFLLSEAEVYGTAEYSTYGEGEQYQYYKIKNNRIKQYAVIGGNGLGNPGYSWLRSPHKTDNTKFCRYGYYVRATAEEFPERVDWDLANNSHLEGISPVWCF